MHDRARPCRGPRAGDRHDDAFQLAHLRRAQPRRAGRGRRDGHDHAAVSRRDDPRRRARHPRVLSHGVGRDRHPDHDPGRAGQPARRCPRRSSRSWRAKSRTCRTSRSRRRRRRSKLRELIELGGDAIVGPWDGEEAITLIPDLDAGATGAMTGGGYPDGIRQIVDAYFAGDTEKAADALSAMAAADQLREPPVRPRRLQGADEGRRRDPLGRGAPSARADASGRARRACSKVARRLDPLVLRWGK